VQDAGEPFVRGLDPADARAFFAARGLTLAGDELTTDAARRLAVDGAEAIPDIYRLATLAVLAG
jgi:hypothetical protein